MTPVNIRDIRQTRVGSDQYKEGQKTDRASQ